MNRPQSSRASCKDASVFKKDFEKLVDETRESVRSLLEMVRSEFPPERAQQQLNSFCQFLAAIMMKVATALSALLQTMEAEKQHLVEGLREAVLRASQRLDADYRTSEEASNACAQSVEEVLREMKKVEAGVRSEAGVVADAVRKTARESLVRVHTGTENEGERLGALAESLRKRRRDTEAEELHRKYKQHAETFQQDAQKAKDEGQGGWFSGWGGAEKKEEKDKKEEKEKKGWFSGWGSAEEKKEEEKKQGWFSGASGTSQPKKEEEPKSGGWFSGTQQQQQQKAQEEKKSEGWFSGWGGGQSQQQQQPPPPLPPPPQQIEAKAEKKNEGWFSGWGSKESSSKDPGKKIRMTDDTKKDEAEKSGGWFSGWGSKSQDGPQEAGSSGQRQEQGPNEQKSWFSNSSRQQQPRREEEEKKDGGWFSWGNKDDNKK